MARAPAHGRRRTHPPHHRSNQFPQQRKFRAAHARISRARYFVTLHGETGLLELPRPISPTATEIDHFGSGANLQRPHYFQIGPGILLMSLESAQKQYLQFSFRRQVSRKAFVVRVLVEGAIVLFRICRVSIKKLALPTLAQFGYEVFSLYETAFCRSTTRATHHLPPRGVCERPSLDTQVSCPCFGFPLV